MQRETQIGQDPCGNLYRAEARTRWMTFLECRKDSAMSNGAMTSTQHSSSGSLWPGTLDMSVKRSPSSACSMIKLISVSVSKMQYSLTMNG